MKSDRKHYTPEFKSKVILEFLREEKTLSQLASEHGIHHSLLVRWRNQALEGLSGIFSDQKIKELMAAHEREVTTLYQEIGQLTTQLAWLKIYGPCRMSIPLRIARFEKA
jgi:transposase-like protein